MASNEKEVPASGGEDDTTTEEPSDCADSTHPQGLAITEEVVLIEQQEEGQLKAECKQEMILEEMPSGNQEEFAQQTLYVAIQPGANMDSSQIEQAQPAVFVEVVEAGSGAEISSDGQVVQEEMVIDNSTTEVTTIPTSVLSHVVDEATLSTMQAEMIAVQVLSQSATGDIQYIQQQNSAQFIPIASGMDSSSLHATLCQMPFTTLQIAAPQPGAVTQTIHLPGGHTIQVPIAQIMSAASTTSTDTTSAVAAPLMTTNTEAIMNAVTQSMESSASQGQDVLTMQQSSGLVQQEEVGPEGEEGEDCKAKYSCEICGKSYIRSWSYYGHMREHASGEKQHKCELCGKVFNYASNLRQHMLIHTGEKPYECEYCDKAFNNPSSLRSHVLSHSEDRPYMCDHEGCGKAFNNPGSLRVHRRVHQEDKPHRCCHEDCAKAFKTSAELSRHAFRHTGEKPHKCDQCEKAFIRYDDLKRHYRIHTGEKPFKCDQCVFACIQSFDLVKHKFTHSGDKPYKCDICPKQFTRPARLRDHMRTHTGEKPYICDVCGKGFAIQTGLKSHQAVHTGDKPFKCVECDKTFRTQIELQSHMARHTGVKPFKCDTCDKEFISAITFKRHAIVHSGEKPFECSECGRRFARSTDLKVHMPVHSEDKPYKCGECEKMFTRFSTLKEHIRTHTGERPFKCEACGREFNHRSHFNNHLRIHTGEKPFKCEVCEKDFSRKASLRYHMKVHSKVGSPSRITRPKVEDGMCGVQELSTEVTTVDHGMAQHATSTVNIDQLGSQAEVQLAEALVAVSEGLVITPQVVAVEETRSQVNEGPAVSVTHQVPGHVIVDPVTQAAVNAGISAADVAHSVVDAVAIANMSQPHHITGPLGNHVVITTSVAGHGPESGEVSVGDVLQSEVRQDQVILQTREGIAMETAAHETVGLSLPVEILAAMAAQMTQLATVPGQQVLETPEGIQQVLVTETLQRLQTADTREQPMDDAQ